MDTTLQLTGIGLRPPHCNEFLATKPPVAWVEVQAEQYFVKGGKALETLQAVAASYPVSFHGSGLSLASSDELNWQHLQSLKELCDKIDACLVSDHLGWSSIDGHYLHNTLPFPFTPHTLEHVCDRIKQVQDFLGQEILIENLAHYFSFENSTMPEWEFLAAMIEKTQCGMLLDVNSLYISSHNLKFDPAIYITTLPQNAIHEIHLAGFTEAVINNETVVINSRNQTVAAPVWELYRKTIEAYGTKPTIIEWDEDLPKLNTLISEANRAETILREVHATTRATI